MTGESTLTCLIKILIALPTCREDLLGEILAYQPHHLGQMIIFDTPSFTCLWVKRLAPCEKLESLVYGTHLRL